MPRFYPNPFLRNPEALPSVDDVYKKVRDKCVSAIRGLCTYLYERTGSFDWSDLSTYTGISGILFVSLRLRNDEQLVQECRLDRFMNEINTHVAEVFRRRDKSKLQKNISVFTSNYTAPCLIGALSEHHNKHSTLGMEAFSAYVKCAKYAMNEMPNEALYGRIGYLAGLIALSDAGYPVEQETIHLIVENILREGRYLSQKIGKRRGDYEELVQNRPDAPALPPLMFKWHDKFYLGAAHGFAGILLTLLKVHEKLPNALPEGSLEELILPTTKWLCKLQQPSGNWPSSLGESLNRDRLMQWCHGATGIVPLMLRAYKVTGDEEYLISARRGADAIWERGLLTKGCGLCHGSAGSGYALLSVYQNTGDAKYLTMAAAVALWCADYFTHAERTPDRPLSLFEGLSGAISFLFDMLQPGKAEFPLIN
uniref:Lanthionine synthetase C-like protein n=1 Tax=Mesocestoides corti TaxID=53468 RepID=A0A5K3F890_MESCO